MTLSERLKSFQLDSYREMSERSGVSEYKISRIMNSKPTSDEIRCLLKLCEYCFHIHISEVLQPTMSIQPSTLVSSRKETINGVQGRSVFYREKQDKLHK